MHYDLHRQTRPPCSALRVLSHVLHCARGMAFFATGSVFSVLCMQGEKAVDRLWARGNTDNEMRNSHFGCKGFTLIEFVVIIVLLGIVAAVVVNRASSRNDLIPQADIVKAHLRFAQVKALSDDVNAWRVVFATNSYSLTCTGTSCPSPSILLPSESSNSHDFTKYGITVTAPLPSILFDSLGNPTGGAVAITLRQGTQTITINVAAAGHVTP